MKMVFNYLYKNWLDEKGNISVTKTLVLVLYICDE